MRLRKNLTAIALGLSTITAIFCESYSFFQSSHVNLLTYPEGTPRPIIKL